MTSPARKIERRTLSRDGFRFELRPHSADLVEQLYSAAMSSAEALTAWMPWFTEGYAISQVDEYLQGAISEWDAATSFEFGIFDREDGAVIGSCGLNSINWSDRMSNLGYWVSTPKGRLGAATQTVQLLWEFGAEDVGLNRMEIVVADGNEPSRRVAEKAGAAYEGLQRKRVMVGEKVYDAHMFACLRE